MILVFCSFRVRHIHAIAQHGVIFKSFVFLKIFLKYLYGRMVYFENAFRWVVKAESRNVTFEISKIRTKG